MSFGVVYVCALCEIMRNKVLIIWLDVYYYMENVL